MQKQIGTRLVIGLFAIAALFFGYQYFANFAEDPDVGDFDSVGYIAAVRQTPDGGRAVLIDPRGNVVEAPAGPRANYDDREVSWGADGQRVFISSSRESDAYNVYRWNPSSEKVERRTTGSRSQGSPWFVRGTDEAFRQFGLILTGGFVFEMNVRTGAMAQVLPPLLRERAVAGEEEGARSPLEALYNDFGESFREARWGAAKDFIFAVMQNDLGRVAIVQARGFDAQGRPFPPREIFRGQHVDLDVTTAGEALVMIRGFQFNPNQPVPEQFVRDGRPVRPFSSGLFRVTVGPDGNPVAQAVVLVPEGSPEGFGDVALSPDGSQLAVVVGEVAESGDFEPRALFVMPFVEGGGQQARPVAPGSISGPSWSGDGRRIAYMRRDGRETAVWTASSGGGDERKLTSGANYTSVAYSPQVRE